jgi:hypothetical protein
MQKHIKTQMIGEQATLNGINSKQAMQANIGDTMQQTHLQQAFFLMQFLQQLLHPTIQPIQQDPHPFAADTQQFSSPALSIFTLSLLLSFCVETVPDTLGSVDGSLGSVDGSLGSVDALGAVSPAEVFESDFEDDEESPAAGASSAFAFASGASLLADALLDDAVDESESSVSESEPPDWEPSDWELSDWEPPD